MRVSGWSSGGGLRGGGDESDTNPKADESKDCGGSPTSPATDEAGDDINEDSEEGSESSLDYGEEGEDLSNTLDEELARRDNIEEADLALPPDGEFSVVVDEIATYDEVEDSIMEDTSTANLTHDLLNSSILLSEKLALSLCEDFENPLSEDDDNDQASEHYQDDNTSDEENIQINCGAEFLEKLDRDYLCSPRLIVRGVYNGEVLQLTMKRKTEGTFVDWSIMNMRYNKQVLLVKGEMTYPYGLSREALGTKFGTWVKGGWKWRGYGYGYVNLFPGSDTSPLHVDIEEAVFFNESVFHHVSGRNCKNIDEDEDVVCKEEGCGVRIWSIKFTTFTTAEEQREYYQPRRMRKERQEQQVFLSMVAYFNGDFRVVVHRDVTLENSYEQSARQMDWLTKDGNAAYNDSPMVDQLKISKAKYTWETSVPKPGRERVNPTTEVRIIPSIIKIPTVINPLLYSIFRATTMKTRMRWRANNLGMKLGTVYHQHQHQKSTEGGLQVMRMFKYHL